MKGPKPKSFAERFWPRVDKSGGSDACWPWLGAHSHGYGAFSIARSRNAPAHRIAYILTYGPIPEGMLVCHRCDNHDCVNPAHLFLGTDADNMHDMIAKGRQASPERTAHKGENNGRAIVTADDVIAIRAAAASGVSQKELAVRYGLKKSAIGYIVSRHNWRHI